MAAKKEAAKKPATTKTAGNPGEFKKTKVQRSEIKGKEKHGPYHMNVRVDCICGNSFTISATIPGPMKIETCYACHQAYNKDKVIKKVVKGRMEKFLEKQKRIDAKK